MQQNINAHTQISDLDNNYDGKLSAQELATACGIGLEDAQACISQFDEDGDGSLDAEEFNNLKEQILAQQRAQVTDQLSHDAFHGAMDADGDGKLSAEELATHCNLTVEEAQNIIYQYDADGDGLLDPNEFEDLKQQILAQQRANMTDKIGANDTLNTLDNNNDGKLTATELATACNISELQARNIVQQYDVDGDGTLDQKEFENLKQQILRQQREDVAAQMDNAQYDAMDDNKDGLVSAYELAQATNISITEAELLIQQYDQNGGGYLDKNEFSNMKQRILKEQQEKERLKQLQQQRQQRQQQQQQQYNDDDKPQHFKHKWKFGMNFDPKNENVVIYISDEITEKNWGITLMKQDFNGAIRQEYRKLGGAVSTGTIKYTYPANGTSLGVLIEGKNGERYTYSCAQQY